MTRVAGLLAPALAAGLMIAAASEARVFSDPNDPALAGARLLSLNEFASQQSQMIDGVNVSVSGLDCVSTPGDCKLMAGAGEATAFVIFEPRVQVAAIEVQSSTAVCGYRVSFQSQVGLNENADGPPLGCANVFVGGTDAEGINYLIVTHTGMTGQTALDNLRFARVAGSATVTTTTSTTTTTLPGGASVSVTPHGAALSVLCEVPNPSAVRKGKCSAQGFASIGAAPAFGTRAEAQVPVTKAVGRRFNKKGRATVGLKLNAAGRKALASRGSLPVSVRTTVTDGGGRSGLLELLVTLLKGSR